MKLRDIPPWTGPSRSSRWYEWWHAIGAEAGQYFKLPFWGRQKVLDAYLLGLHDAARVAEKHRWSREHGHCPNMTAALKSIHAYHNEVERHYA